MPLGPKGGPGWFGEHRMLLVDQEWFSSLERVKQAEKNNQETAAAIIQVRFPKTEKNELRNSAFPEQHLGGSFYLLLVLSSI